MYHIASEQIEAFLTLAQKKNFRETSEMLFITQPTVTKYIQRLEKELQVELFSRTTQSVELTDAGNMLFEMWMPLYRRFLESIEETRHNALERGNQLVISVLRDYYSPAAALRLSELFEAYLKNRALDGPSLSFRFLSMREQREALKSRQIDFSFSLGFDYENLRYVDVKILTRRKIYALLPSFHPLASKNEVSLHDLEGETFVVISPFESFHANHVTISMLYKYLRRPEIIIAANLQSMAFSLQKGEGITLGNRYFFQNSISAYFVEMPVSELKNAGYEETLAYGTDDMPDKKKIFIDFMQNDIGKLQTP